MKGIISLIITIISFTGIQAQEVGINTSSPLSPMHVMAFGSNVMTLENQMPLDNNTQNNLYFAYGFQGPNPTKYAACIKTTGLSSSTARLGFLTNAANAEGALIERLSISNDGNVGIGTITPAYDLDVNGTSRFSSSVGIMTPPSGSYALSVVGSARMFNDFRIDGILNPNNPLAIGNNTSIEGSLTVNNGKGIVRSTNSTQMKIRRTYAPFYGTINPGGTITSGVVNFGEDFSSVTVLVGQINDGTGEFQKAFMAPFNVNVNTNTFQVHLTNVSNSAITFSGTWEFVLIGN